MQTPDQIGMSKTYQEGGNKIFKNEVTRIVVNMNEVQRVNRSVTTLIWTTFSGRRGPTGARHCVQAGKLEFLQVLGLKRQEMKLIIVATRKRRKGGDSRSNKDRVYELLYQEEKGGHQMSSMPCIWSYFQLMLSGG